MMQVDVGEERDDVVREEPMCCLGPLASDQTEGVPFPWLPQRAFDLCAEAGPQYGVSNWVVATLAPRGPLDSGGSLIFQVTLPANPPLTDPVLSKNNPAGGGQVTGPRGSKPCFVHSRGVASG